MGGTPKKWLVYNGKSQSKMDDLGVPPFQETPIRRFPARHGGFLQFSSIFDWDFPMKPSRVLVSQDGKIPYIIHFRLGFTIINQPFGWGTPMT